MISISKKIKKVACFVLAAATLATGVVTVPQKTDAAVNKAAVVKAGRTGEFVTGLYARAFSRRPDDGGYAYWCGVINNNSYHTSDVIRGFIYSEEFKNLRYNDRDYVKAVYYIMLGRSATNNEINMWIGAFKSGAAGRTTVVNDLLKSGEYSKFCASYGLRP